MDEMEELSDMSGEREEMREKWEVK